jgi:magnesium-dependent phosphatase 1
MGLRCSQQEYKGIVINCPYKLVVFDLDFTLWDAGGLWCDHLSAPFEKRHGKVFDQRGREVRLYEGVREILHQLDVHQIPMAVASKTMEASWADELLKLHEIAHYFQVKEMYPLSKVNHFRVIHEITQIDYEDMIFFDDEYGNIVDVSALGVNCVHLTDGLTESIFRTKIS